MNAKKIILVAAVVLLCFAAGFIFADSANRKEQERLRAELARVRGAKPAPDNTQPPAQNPEGGLALPDLTDEELREAIARADARPDDARLQHTAGQALHVYALQKNKAAILSDVARILKRAHEAEPDNYDILLRLANSLYITATNGQPERMGQARSYFEKASRLNPQDPYVRTSLGMTYFHDTPPDPKRAVREFRQALAINPRDELTLQNMPAALIAVGEFAEAEKMITELEKIAPAHEAVSNLRAQLAAKRNGAREGN